MKLQGISQGSLRKIAKAFNKTSKFDLLDMLRQYMDDTEILEELTRAMSDDEAKENFEYIMQMHDLGSDFE